MMTGLLSLAFGYIAADGIGFTVAKFMGKSVATDLVEKTQEHSNLWWAVSKIKRNNLSVKDRKKYDEIKSTFETNPHMNLRSGT